MYVVAIEPNIHCQACLPVTFTEIYSSTVGGFGCYVCPVDVGS